MKHTIWRTLNTPLVFMHYLLLMLVCLVIADGLITKYLVEEGLVREGNVILQPIVDQSHFLWIKAVGAIACALILWDIHTRWAKLALISTSLLVLGYSAIVVWNVLILATSH